MKIRKVSIDKAFSCPFYVQTDAKECPHVCALKHALPQHVWRSLMETDTTPLDVAWSEDCQGQWEKCAVLPIFYDISEESESSSAPTTDPEADNYDPFEKEDTVASPPPQEEVSKVQVSVYKVENPYQVKCDVLVYPTNMALQIDDDQLRMMSNGMIQRQCQEIVKQAESMKTPIRMGRVYYTTTDRTHVKAKAIFHAVVAGVGRLVQADAIKKSMYESLIKAEAAHAKSVVVVPADCGTLDLNITAEHQLSAIREFISGEKQIQYIQNIYLVMRDDPSVEVFGAYFDRIFKQ